ncbi:MAG: helix-turn-helix transcriptional regulator [Parvibaculum sp.]|nr:helix-turn-helix transcriptional regulator [Parvibaculum sp.]
MRTRIRHFRKQRGLTQTELAQRLGTTAATVSRLETADMTVSTGWLERIAGELAVGVRDLLDAPAESRHAVTGEVRRGGNVFALPKPEPVPPSLLSLAHEPMAFRIGETLGAYAGGDVLVADRMAVAEAVEALGRDCFAGGAEGDLAFGRLALLDAQRCLLMPPESGAPPREFLSPVWIAPVVTLLRNYPPVRRTRPGN